MKGIFYTMNNKIIGQRINTLLAIKNMKQKELAKELGITDNTVSYFVNGSRVPNIQQIIKISQIFNVSTDYILGVTNAMSTDADIKAICEYTGLSEKAIENIQSLKNFPFTEQYKHIDTTNLFFEYPEFSLLCGSIYENCFHYLQTCKGANIDMYNASRYLTNKIFESIIDSAVMRFSENSLMEGFYGNNTEEK